MELLNLQRDVQGLQAQCIAIRWEKDIEVKKKKLLHLYNTLVVLAREVNDMYEELDNKT